MHLSLIVPGIMKNPSDVFLLSSARISVHSKFSKIIQINPCSCDEIICCQNQSFRAIIICIIITIILSFSTSFSPSPTLMLYYVPRMFFQPQLTMNNNSMHIKLSADSIIFEKIFNCCLVPMKQSGVLNAELDSNSNNGSRLSIKNYTKSKKLKIALQ